ncbi:MAG: hypothetical protein RIT45_3456 [Pseudomonadota bacterium]|jgi:transposase-like protein/methylmalonyl-CoA mutase cobalamin-binding subunit
MASEALLSIGALARLCGVPPDTLRTWERRYGRPSAIRLPSGHRRYATSWVDEIARWKALMEQGHSAADVIGTPGPTSAALLALGRNSDAVDPALVARWVRLAIAHDHAGLTASLLATADRVGALRFADDLAGPFLAALGEAWADGRLSVAAEHGASERFRDVVAQRWRALSEAHAGPPLLLTTLPGELHDLGLQLAALVAAVQGRALVFLGRDTPRADIAAAFAETGATALVVSVSRFAEPVGVEEDLRWLRARLPGPAPILVGGDGAPPTIPGIVRLRRFADLVPHLELPPGGLAPDEER